MVLYKQRHVQLKGSILKLLYREGSCGMSFLFTVIFGIIGIILSGFLEVPSFIGQGFIFGILIDLYIKVNETYKEIGT